MSSFQDTWHDATVDEQPDRTQPPQPGTGYTVAVRDAKAITAKSGEDWVIIELEGITGAAAEHQWSVLQGFKSAQQAGFTKRVVRDLGVDIDAVTSLDDLDQQLKAHAVGRYFTVDVVQNGEYRNTYFRGAAGPPAQEELPAAAVGGGPGSATEDDGTPIPF